MAVDAGLPTKKTYEKEKAPHGHPDAARCWIAAFRDMWEDGGVPMTAQKLAGSSSIKVYAVVPPGRDGKKRAAPMAAYEEGKTPPNGSV